MSNDTHELFDMIGIIQNRVRWADRYQREIQEHLDVGIYAKHEVAELRDMVKDLQEDLGVAVSRCVLFQRELDRLEKEWPSPTVEEEDSE